MNFKSINICKECMAGRQLQRFIIFVNFTVFEAHFSKNIQQIKVIYIFRTVITKGRIFFQVMEDSFVYLFMV